MISRLAIWARAIRVEQWTKNGVVMMAWFFSVADSSQTALVRGWRSFLMAVAMAGAFSLVSSAFYLLNDVADFDEDRLHPVKRYRPVAARLISRISAVRVALVLFAVGFAYPALVVMLMPSRTVAFGTILAYTVMQCLYTGFLKRLPYVDVATRGSSSAPSRSRCSWRSASARTRWRSPRSPAPSCGGTTRSS